MTKAEVDLHISSVKAEVDQVAAARLNSAISVPGMTKAEVDAYIAKVEAARIKYQSRQKSPKAITPPSVPPLLTSQRTVPLDSHRHGASSVRSQSQSGDPHRNGGGRTDRTNVTAQLLELEVRRQSSLP